MKGIDYLSYVLERDCYNPGVSRAAFGDDSLSSESAIYSLHKTQRKAGAMYYCEFIELTGQEIGFKRLDVPGFNSFAWTWGGKFGYDYVYDCSWMEFCEVEGLHSRSCNRIQDDV